MTISCSQSAFSQDDSLFGRTDSQKEIEIGRAVYDSYLRQGLISRNDLYKRRVERVLTQLLDALPGKLYPFQATVIASNEVNAWCAPGGYICVYEGLLTKMPHDEQLAFTLAHEIGHGACRHAMMHMRKMQVRVIIDLLVATVSRTNVDTEASQLASLKFSREEETEADRFGTELYLKAGFDALKILEGMEVLVSEGGGRHIPEYLSTHPNSERRLHDIQTNAAKLLKSGLKAVEVTLPKINVDNFFGTIPTASPLPSTMFILAPGCIWKYRVVSKSGITSGYEVKVIGVETVGVVQIASMEIDIGPNKVSYQALVDGNRLWRRNRPREHSSPWTTEVIIPNSGHEEGDGNWSYQFVCVENVVTPSQEYLNCTKIREVAGKRSYLCWFAPQVGLVKRESIETGTTESLENFHAPLK